MTHPTRMLRNCALAAGLIAAAWGCGQQGPLTLPEQARPIERIEQPPAAEPEQDDERTRER